MVAVVFDKFAEKLAEEKAPFAGSIKVTLWESHKAWASYSGDVDAIAAAAAAAAAAETTA